jgi:hypothetical protein
MSSWYTSFKFVFQRKHVSGNLTPFTALVAQRRYEEVFSKARPTGRYE